MGPKFFEICYYCANCFLYQTRSLRLSRPVATAASSVSCFFVKYRDVALYPNVLSYSKAKFVLDEIKFCFQIEILSQIRENNYFLQYENL